MKARRANDQWWRYTYEVGTPKQVIEARAGADVDGVQSCL